MRKSTGVELFLRAALGRGYPRVIGAQRELSWLFFDIVIPLITMSASVFLYKALQADPAYIGFVVLGAALATYWLNVLWMMASQLYWDKQAGLLEIYIMSPASMMAILLGMGVGGLYMSTLRAGFIAVVGTLLFSVQMDVSQWGAAALVFFVTMVALYGLGMVLSSVFLMWGREAWQVSLALQEPVFFMSGMNFPLNQLFNSIQALTTVVSAVIPVGLGLDALRQLLFPGKIEGVLPWGLELGALAVMGVVFVTVAYLMLKRMEWLAKVEARLSLRWQ
ncbi:MAG: ABC transporter permease [Chloroflexota bacterium]|nr:ABC transporter permease [Chloroflexota bacterium]MDQ5864147.1 ABC transporter permease [Chloroflexota bacterium]